MNDREIICIHVGQAGIQIGNAVWELFRFEHELTEQGFQECYCNWPLIDNTKSLFIQNNNGKFIPRCCIVDSEPMVVDEIRTSVNDKFFDPRNLINGKEAAATIFARGYNSCANDVLDDCVTSIRLSLEQTNLFSGFVIFHSLGGGTGSGLTTRLAEMLQDETPRKPMIHLCIASPSVNSGFAVEPYNNILSVASLLESSNLMCMMHNDALYKSYDSMRTNIKCFGFTNINRKIAQITSSLTMSYRFSNMLSSDFCIFQTNLIPYPGIHFPITSYAPLAFDDISLPQMTKSCFTSQNMTLSLDPKEGYNIACCLLYRGVNCRPMAINKAIQNLKSDPSIRFVNWCPTGFKVAINIQMPGDIPGSHLPRIKRSLCVLTNNTAITQVWSKALEKFQKLFTKKAFLHWFSSEGIEESTFKSAEENIIDLMSKYKALQSEGDVHISNEKSTRVKPMTLKSNLNSTKQSKIVKPVNQKDTIKAVESTNSPNNSYKDYNKKEQINKMKQTSEIHSSEEKNSEVTESETETSSDKHNQNKEKQIGKKKATSEIHSSEEKKSKVTESETEISNAKHDQNKEKPIDKKKQTSEIQSSEERDSEVTESETEISNSQYNYNKNSYFKSKILNLTKKIPLKTSSIDSISELNSLFFDRNQSYTSTPTLFRSSMSSLIAKPKLQSFTTILRLSILDLSRYKAIEKKRLYTNPETSTRFLSKYRRLYSKINILNVSTESFCVNFLNRSLKKMENLPVTQSVVRSRSIDFNKLEIHSKEVFHESPNTFLIYPKFIDENSQLYNSVNSLRTENQIQLLYSENKPNPNSFDSISLTSKHLLPSKISRIFSRRSQYRLSSSPKVSRDLIQDSSPKRCQSLFRRIFPHKSVYKKPLLNNTPSFKLSLTGSANINLIDSLLDHYINEFLN